MTTAADGKNYWTSFYNLDVIISVGYRVKSKRGTQFRLWATRILKEYLLNGYAVNQRLIAMEERIDRRLAQHDSILQKHQEKIDFFVQANLPPVEKVFFDGDFFEARVLLEKLEKQHRIGLLSLTHTLMPLHSICLMCVRMELLPTFILARTCLR